MLRNRKKWHILENKIDFFNLIYVNTEIQKKFNRKVSFCFIIYPIYLLK